MRGGLFSSLCSAALLLPLLAQSVVAHDEHGQLVSVEGYETSNWVMRRGTGAQYACKCYPGDSCWPNHGQFQKLNNTVGGNLRVNIPPGAPCYKTFKGPLGDVRTYNKPECDRVTANFADEQFQ